MHALGWILIYVPVILSTGFLKAVVMNKKRWTMAVILKRRLVRRAVSYFRASNVTEPV